MSTLPTILEEASFAIESGKTPAEKWEACSKDFPWYPMPWLFKALDGTTDNLQKAALWVPDEMRLHWLLNAEEEVEVKVEAKVEAKVEVEVKDEVEVEIEEVEPEALVIIEEKIEEKILLIEPLAEETELKEPVELVELVLEKETAPEQENKPAEKEAETEEKADFQVPALNIAATDKAHPILAFEPMHMVDYFASQGIKLDPSALPVTKIDQQVKSFTQWLKTMKRVNYQPDSAKSDSLVDAQATASLQEKETITEAMAEVLAKQDKFLKAIGVFEKLILLHPEKSAFFAARIKELREKL